MKKLLLLTLILALSSIFSSPAGNPSFPKAIEEGFFISSASSISFRLGYEGNFVLNRRLKQDVLNGKRVNDFSQYLNSGLLTINILNRCDLFGSFGKAKIKTNWIFEETTNAFSYVDLETKYGDAWSSGVKIIFFEWGNTALSAGGRYNYTKPKISWVSKNGETTPYSENHLKYKQWQADVGISHKMDMFIPYILAKYSKADVNLRTPSVIINPENTDKMKMKSKNNYGMALGCALVAQKYFMLNLEVRLIDEEAFTVIGDFRF